MSAEMNYWDIRAQKLVEYKGEKFYTITPIPYYYERRKILLNMLKKIFTEQHAVRVLDLGCGDGEYIYHLSDNNIKFHGVDISAEMIKLASKKCNHPNISFEISGDGVHGQTDFDIAYIISVLAHVDDNTVELLLKSAYQSLSKQGMICIFEQIAPIRFRGGTYIRRTYREYYDMLEKQGFKLVANKCVRVDFVLHRKLFERRIAKLFYRKYAMKFDNYRTYCNNNTIFRVLSHIFTMLSWKRIHTSMDGWGYCFICAQKD